MPRLLQQRLRPQTIEEFLAAAQCRFIDGDKLVQMTRRTAAVYLWGFAAEMVVKAAFFRLMGFGPRRHITRVDLRLIENEARIHGIGLRSLHDIENLALTLIAARARLGQPLASGLEADLRRRSQRLARIWRETLRYHSNIAYAFEMGTVQQDVVWFLHRQSQL